MSAAVIRPQSLGEWNAYVESGQTREERRRRLAECPERWREQVRKHVEICFSVRRYYRRQGGAGEG